MHPSLAKKLALRLTTLLIFFLPAWTLLHASHNIVGKEIEPENTRSFSTKNVIFSHLKTKEHHDQFLKGVLRSAKKSVLITSYSIDPEQFFKQGIDLEIINASNRGIRVYIYYKKLCWLEKNDYVRLKAVKKCCARFEQIYNHSKCIAQDNEKVAIGSFNWLSAKNDTTVDRSWVVSGLFTRELINDVWQCIKFYQNLAYGNTDDVLKFFKDEYAFSTDAYRFAPGEYCYTLRTPEAHAKLLHDEIFSKAQKEIFICSPFIRLQTLKNILTHSMIQKLEERKVRFHLFTLSKPCSLVPWEHPEIFKYLRSLSRQFSHFSYSVHTNLHCKTIIADDLLCEGSLNILSAVSDLAHDANNFEISLAVRGQLAAPFISAFREGELGKCVKPLKAPTPKKNEYATHTQNLKRSATQTQNQMSLKSTIVPSKKLRTPKIEILSGAVFNRYGYCARIDGNYLRDDEGKISYFFTQELARKMAMDYWSMDCSLLSSD